MVDQSIFKALKLITQRLSDRLPNRLPSASASTVVTGSGVEQEDDPLVGNSPSLSPRDFFNSQSKKVVTFVGYSGSGYEDEAAMLNHARSILAKYDPQDTIVNIGATSAGIGEVYRIAKEMGFATTGIVSSLATEHGVEISPFVDHVFVVEDSTWGGFLGESQELSPTSQAMVEVSDVIVGIGGGTIGRDEMLSAKGSGKQVLFIAADFDHALAVDRARRNGLDPPQDFRGEAHKAFGIADA